MTTAYIIMKQTDRNLVAQVFDILTEQEFTWEDNTKPKRHMKEYMLKFDFQNDIWDIRHNTALIINITTKKLSYFGEMIYTGTPWWLERDCKIIRCDELETIQKLKNFLLILNKEDVQ